MYRMNAMFNQTLSMNKFTRNRIIPCASGDKPLELPGGGYWWLKDTAQQQHSNRVIELHGANFVLRRSKLSHHPSSPPSPSTGLVRQSSPFPPVPISTNNHINTTALSGIIVIDTSFQVIQEKEEAQEEVKCLGIVPVSPSFDTFTTPTTTDTNTLSSSHHPRRTRKVRFTCNLCESSNEKWVNPQAWSSGSVFVQCDGCTVVHKLIDNLNIFSELAGPVFPPVELRDTFLVQEVLDRIEKKKRGKM